MVVSESWGPAAEDAVRTALLVAGGPLSAEESPRLREAAVSGWRIGVDSGTHHWLNLGLLPDYVLGDFDSLTETECHELAAQGVIVVPTPDQDFTDLDKAVAFALETLRANRLRVYAGTGGRLDHIYSVLSVLVKYGRRVDIRLVDAVGETWLVNGTETLRGADLPGRVLSLMAMGPVAGVTTTGVRWPLTGESLAPGVRDGTLNVVIHEEVTISVEEGDLLVMLHHS